jgi:hypothetical protein
MSKRRAFTPEFKAQGVLEELTGGVERTSSLAQSSPGSDV